MQVFTTTEISAALFQAVIALGLVAVFAFLHLRYRKPHFLWWAVAFGLYTFRLSAIIAFLASDRWSWLFWHQIATGWTALGLLWAALVFSRQTRLRAEYLLILLFPVVWSYVAIFQLDNFLLAAAPAVAFLSVTTLWTGWVFLRYRRRTGSRAARFLAITFALWALHHLDYPFLRARGAWNPWGYYLDTVFLLVAGAGVLLLVIEELRQGVMTMAALSADLQPRAGEDVRTTLLRRPLTLGGVRGAALFEPGRADRPVAGAGSCETWPDTGPPDALPDLVAQAESSGQVVIRGAVRPAPGAPAFSMVLPLRSRERSAGALVMVGDQAAPFAALDNGVLVAMGDQIGAALERAQLYHDLELRSADLERLSVRMLQQHEEQRQRLARELHDETAQVFSALKLQLGSLREHAPAGLADRIATLLELVSAGRRSIRHVTEDLRPALLDDLGLVPALRALIADFHQWSGIEGRFAGPDRLPPLAPAAELALFRAVQEGLSNVARHAQAGAVAVRLAVEDGAIQLELRDDGDGMDAALLGRVSSGPGRSGLFGMRERLGALGGTVRLESAPGSGLTILLALPLDGGHPHG